MNLFTIAASSFVVALSGAVSPGPLLAVTVTRSINYGAMEGPLLIAGHSILEFIMVVLLVAGFGTYFKQPLISNILGIIGGSVLVLMAVLMFKKLKSDFVVQADSSRMKGQSIFGGIIVSFLNPYWTIWWLTIGLAYLSIALPRGLSGVAAFFVGHILADFSWYSFVSYSISKGKKKISPLVYKVINTGCALFLMGFGIFLVVKTLI
jgi:threonine/homoserine/homoserine lactone efflux protein